MKIFPDISSYGFSDIQFISHLPKGYPTILKFLSKLGKKAEKEQIWLFYRYKRKGIKHVGFLAFVKSEQQCADIIIRISTKYSPELDKENIKEHQMTQKEFLRIFRYLLSFDKKNQPSRIAYRFKRYYKNPIFKEDSNKKYQVKGIKLRGTKESPVEFINIDEYDDGKVKLDITAKPVFRFSRKLINDKFFSLLLRDMILLSDSLYYGIEKGKL